METAPLGGCKQKCEPIRIYLFPAAMAARLIVSGCDDFSGSATRSLKCVQIFQSCLASNFSEFLLPLILQTCWVRQFNPAGCSQSVWSCSVGPAEHRGKLFLCDEPPSHSWTVALPTASVISGPAEAGWTPRQSKSRHQQQPFQSCRLGKKKKKEKNNTYVSTAFLRSLASFFLEKTEMNPEPLLPFGGLLSRKSQTQERCFLNVAQWK